MSLRSRKLFVLITLASILMLANAHTIACWLGRIGLIRWAQDLRAEYVTGTAITVILVLLFLLGGTSVINRCAHFIRRCPVCDHTLFRTGNYCGACGSRVA